VKTVGTVAFQMGPWRVDPTRDEISRDGTAVKLEPRTMRVLICLAERDGNVISVNELLDAVWKDLVVTQYSVYQAVAVLRRALGDDPKDPTYIASVPRRGYRLVAPVEVETPVPQPEAVTERAPPAENPAVPDSQPAQLPAIEPAEHLELTPPGVSERVALRRGWRYGSLLFALLALAGGVGWYFLRSMPERPTALSPAHAPDTPARVETAGVAFAPPMHSVAVLPFTNLSGDPKQEYFSDGMTEELINALAQIDTLKVIARTSSFSFKGKDADIDTIAHKLNVAAVLEGSVRRSGNTVRVTVQLINGVNGFHIWSQDYDRDLNNVLALQTDIAKAVAVELQAKLLGNEAPKIELGGTRIAAAFDAYLRGAKAYSSSPDNPQELQTAIASYTEAINLDRNYALAFAGRSVAYSGYASEYAKGAAIREGFDKAQADARQALALAPALAEGHLALARLLEAGALDFAQASEEYERAVALAPGNADVLRESGRFAAHIGHFDVGIAAVQRAVALDPLNPRGISQLGRALYFARRYREAAAAFAELIRLDPDNKFAFGARGLAQYGMGELQSARTSCEVNPDHWVSLWCLAMTYDKLGRRADAEAAVAKMKAANGVAAAYQYATIYAQWGDAPKSLQWLDTAVRGRDPGLPNLKADPLMDPLRGEAHFQAIERALKFPN
jgi:TolB-like protein/DNA-binding winged helix-turn-helix (wHTH) protein/Tfp pilus assembly protein PilF